MLNCIKDFMVKCKIPNLIIFMHEQKLLVN